MSDPAKMTQKLQPKRDGRVRSNPRSGGIYQEVDGFHYFDPPNSHGGYAAHTLREIAAKLDEMNESWAAQIERELMPPNTQVLTRY